MTKYQQRLLLCGFSLFACITAIDHIPSFVIFDGQVPLLITGFIGLVLLFIFSTMEKFINKHKNIMVPIIIIICLIMIGIGIVSFYFSIRTLL